MLDPEVNDRPRLRKRGRAPGWSADPGGREPADKLRPMNPRYRRLVIPRRPGGADPDRGPSPPSLRVVAWAEPLVRALARVRGLLLDDDGPGARRRLRAPEGADPALAPGRAALRRPQGRPPPPGDGVRRDAGAHRQPRARRRRARRASTPCWTSRSATGTSRPTTETHQLRVTKKREALVHTSQRTPGWRPSRRRLPSPAAHDRREAAAAARGRPAAPRARDRRRARAGSSPAGRRSTARSRSSCAASAPAVDDAHRLRSAAHARRRRSRCGWSTWAAATPI